MWRLLNNFQHLVGAFGVHAFRQPYYAHLISALTRLQTKRTHHHIAFAHTHLSLLVGRTHGRKPLVHCEVWPLRQQMAPLARKVLTRHLVFRAGARWAYDGVGEMKVWMSQLICHDALSARSAAVVARIVLAQQI